MTTMTIETLTRILIRCAKQFVSLAEKALRDAENERVMTEE